VETEQFEENLGAMSQTDRDRASQLAYKWMADPADKIRGASKLQPAEQALLRRRIDWGDGAG
jgi:hypothetical protein